MPYLCNLMIDGIRTYLSHFTKDMLTLLLDFFDQKYQKNARKADLLTQAASYLATDPVSWIMQLPERDIKLLRKLSLCGSEDWVEMDMPEYPSVLSALHLIVEDDSADGTFMALAPESLMTVVRPFIDQIIEDKEMMGVFKAERIALGILNTYGVLEISEFVKILLKMFEKQKDPDEIVSTIAKCSILSIQKVPYGDCMYIVSPYVFDYAHIIEGRKEFKKVRKYATITLEDALSAGSGVPYCVYGAGRPELETIRTALESIGYNGHETEKLLTDIWMNSQFTMQQACAESMFRCVNEKIDDIPSFREYRRIVDAIAAYANSTPKWLLKGRRPDDVNLMKLAIKVDESIIEGAEEAWEECGPEDAKLPDPIEAYYRNSMAVRHVPPFAPCPCGSGLSYKNCHGKKLS